MKPRIGVGVLIFKDGRVLLGKRKGSHGVGYWAAPGGHLEFGESIEECAMRELAEETGLTALSVQTGRWSNNMIDGNKQYITFFAVVDRFEGELQLREPHKCEEWLWFSEEALPDPLFPPINSFFEQCRLAPPAASHEQLLTTLLDFYHAREWGPFHSPKNLE